MFEDEERAQLQPYDGVPYDVPLWREVTVHSDHHVNVQYALYSAPSTTCPPGTELEARCDQGLVKLYRGGDLVKVHPRKPKGGRSTDADDYPAERTAYAMRAPDRIVSQALKLGPSIGRLAERLLEGHFPWSKRFDLVDGEPGREICAAAAAWSADLVVLRASCHSRPEPGPRSVGHTARFVLDYAACPVLLILG